MSMTILGVGDIGATSTRGMGLKTFALGSCVAVILHHAQSGTVGMAHVALPDSSINTSRAQDKPGHFADSGLIALLRAVLTLSRLTRPTCVSARLVGGATIIRSHSLFNVGPKNVHALRMLLKQYGIPIKAEDIGGAISRTVSVDAGSGVVRVNSPGRGAWDV